MRCGLKAKEPVMSLGWMAKSTSVSSTYSPMNAIKIKDNIKNAAKYADIF